MARSERLIDLIQVLRRHRRPVSGRQLAEETGVSLRTLYRDIASLQAQGAEIEGEAGVGYVLKPGFLLPPMMFSEEEIEALVLGLRWVTKRGDKRLAAAAADALAKIGSVLPAELKEKLDGSTLLVGPRQPVADRIDLGVLRKAIRSEQKLELGYLDNDGRDSRRTVWPFALGFFEETRVLAAWCELRQDFRHFRTDRIAEAAILDSRYPRRRQALLKDWRAARGVDPVGV
ncbi:helix-turn-helix transcriptional regulator [Sinorhizobium americanum]|uniref:Transcriptional regulator n=1 Tax=Sinorhizobium americanum TaxID=194963 RepID=A0A1L3LHE3_9HYPH|nr:YafY family protein [Sinorhizobium americanum]APG89476.1 transcriptional regulator [Sinorhizobium americanum]OAP36176.1 DNA-binding protein [Sinorhizobium americanum]